MSSYRKWSAEEESILLDRVKAHPENLKCGFIEAAERVNRTQGACENHWYNVVSKDPDPDKTVFVTVSGHHVCRNRKNSAGAPIRVSKFHRIVKILFG